MFHKNSEKMENTSFNTINPIAAIYGIFDQYILTFLALQVMTFLIYKKIAIIDHLNTTSHKK